MFVARHSTERNATQHVHGLELAKDGDERTRSCGQHYDHLKSCRAGVFYSLEMICVSIN